MRATFWIPTRPINRHQCDRSCWQRVIVIFQRIMRLSFRTMNITLGRAPRLFFTCCGRTTARFWGTVRNKISVFKICATAPNRTLAAARLLLPWSKIPCASTTGGNWNACSDVVPRLCFTSVGWVARSILEDDDHQQQQQQQRRRRLPLHCLFQKWCGASSLSRNHEVHSWMWIQGCFLRLRARLVHISWKTDD